MCLLAQKSHEHDQLLLVHHAEHWHGVSGCAAGRVCSVEEIQRQIDATLMLEHRRTLQETFCQGCQSIKPVSQLCLQACSVESPCRNYACWSDEDFVGQCARIARSSGTHSLGCTLRCTQKMLGKNLKQFKILRSRLDAEQGRL